MGLAAVEIASSLNLHANPLGLPIGCQTWPVKEMLAQDVPGTFKQLSAAGFQAIELCSPIGYAVPGFAAVGKYSPAELRTMLSDINLVCHSSHFSMKELRQDQPRSIEWAHQMGLTQMSVASLGGPKQPTLDDVKRAADEYNRIADGAHKAGLQQVLHNEVFECSTVDGKRTYDLLFDLLDPNLVKFQFQVSTISEGFDAADYFTRYPGRFISMHAQGWSATTHKIVPVGQGTLDWKRIFTAAKTGGIQNYFVEMNLDYMRASVPYLKSLEV